MISEVGPFRILSPIGRGAMSETFVAERMGPAGVAQRVCLKIQRTLDGDPRWAREFLAEARLIASLKHPNIVSLVDFGSLDLGRQGTGWWMALDLVEGVDLRAILASLATRGERMPLDCALHVVIGLTKALRHAHARRLPDGSVGLVHRDLSPGNVMVSFDGEVMLTDFGLAKIEHGERTRTGHQKGKHEYMSPEQAMSEPLDGRSDLFALGILLYEMLAGERPFDGPTYLATQMRIVKGERRPIREVVPDLSREVEALVEKLLSVDRAGRYASPSELLDALGAWAPRPSVVASVAGLAAHGAR